MLINYEQWRCDWSTVSNPRGPCKRCAALDSRIFEEGEGPYPSLHPDCHCRRVFHHSVLMTPAMKREKYWDREEEEE